MSPTVKRPQIDLPILGSHPYDLQVAIERLRENLEMVMGRMDATESALSAMPMPLTIEEIAQQLGPLGSNPLPTAGLLNTTPPPVNPPPSPPTPGAAAPEDRLAIVESVLAAQVPPLSDLSPVEQIFRFAQQVVWEISLLGPDANGSNVGLLEQFAGDFIFTCAGISYATFRICYDNGANMKILTGGWAAQWTQEGDIDVANWKPPTAPGSPC